MKVMCIRIPGVLDGTTLESSPWLTLDATYTVTSIGAEPSGRLVVQVITDHRGQLGWFESSAFLTVDATIPENWVARVGESGHLDLCPEAWLAPGFWEAYYDGDAAAAQSVEAELRRMGVLEA